MKIKEIEKLTQNTEMKDWKITKLDKPKLICNEIVDEIIYRWCKDDVCKGLDMIIKMNWGELLEMNEWDGLNDITDDYFYTLCNKKSWRGDTPTDIGYELIGSEEDIVGKVLVFCVGFSLDV